MGCHWRSHVRLRARRGHSRPDSRWLQADRTPCRGGHGAGLACRTPLCTWPSGRGGGQGVAPWPAIPVGRGAPPRPLGDSETLTAQAVSRARAPVRMWQPAPAEPLLRPTSMSRVPWCADGSLSEGLVVRDPGARGLRWRLVHGTLRETLVARAEARGRWSDAIWRWPRCSNPGADGRALAEPDISTAKVSSTRASTPGCGPRSGSARSTTGVRYRRRLTSRSSWARSPSTTRGTWLWRSPTRASWRNSGGCPGPTGWPTPR